MKKNLLALFFIIVTFSGFAQVPQKLPLDPKVITGQLDNGLTYFIMKNSKPVEQAEFFIVQKVGSILEEENQRGLAHFLEHMAFNGSENFPENKLISWLESIGVKFGVNLNAYTAIDQTVYNISGVPLRRESIVDSCLLILRDWSCAISLNGDDIDKERGVIREEARTTNSAGLRMLERALPEIMPDSKYAHRLPIGLMEVVNNFTYKELRDYYHKWYRPDLQGIIVVGDIDPVVIENKIKTLFGAIPKPINPAERYEVEVPDTKGVIATVQSDPEATSTNISISFKKDVLEKEYRPTVISLVSGYMNAMVTSMMKDRFSAISEKPDAPFLGADASYGQFVLANTKDAFDLSAYSKEGGWDKALKALVNEIEKVKQFGFTDAEYERAKADYITSMESIYKEKDKQNNSFYVRQIVDHFLTEDAMPGIEAEYSIMQSIIPAITLDKINEYAKDLPSDDNVVIVLMMPEKEGLKVPTSADVIALYNDACKETVEPYKEEVSNEPLISEMPTAGKVISESKDPITGSTVWNLSNGATVVIKKTDFKDDEILFSAASLGGASLFDAKDIASISVMDDVLSVGGLGKFSAIDLRKVLAGKNASLSSSISLTEEALSGSATPKDLETMMQLAYLSFTSIRKDDDAYRAYINRRKDKIINSETNPSKAFRDTIQSVLFHNNPYSKSMDVPTLEKADYGKALEFAKSCFSNAANFTFVFVGNVDESTLKPMVEKYIASLPGVKGEKSKWKDVGLLPTKGVINNKFEREMQTPKATVLVARPSNMQYNLENLILAQIARQAFDLIFTKTIREEEGGTYGVGVSMSINYYPIDNSMFLYSFDTDVPLTEKLIKRAELEIQNTIKNGISQEDFAKICEYMTKTYQQNLKENSYWLSVIDDQYVNGYDHHSDYEKVLKSITKEKVEAFIRQALANKDRIEIIMSGKPMAK